MNEQGKSPVGKPVAPAGNKTIDFFGALKQVLNGNRIHKLEWTDKEYYGFMKDGFLTLHKPGGSEAPWWISNGDMGGTDWIVL